MTNPLIVQLVTPERTIFKQEFESLTCPTELGQITILPGHADLVSTLEPGEVIGKTGKEEEIIHVAGGFIRVNDGHNVILLADAAERVEEIDEQRAEEARKRAEKILSEQVLSDEEYAMAAASLKRSLSRLNISRKHSHRKTNPITSEGVYKE